MVIGTLVNVIKKQYLYGVEPIIEITLCRDLATQQIKCQKVYYVLIFYKVPRKFLP